MKKYFSNGLFIFGIVLVFGSAAYIAGDKMHPLVSVILIGLMLMMIGVVLNLMED